MKSARKLWPSRLPSMRSLHTSHSDYYVTSLWHTRLRASKIMSQYLTRRSSHRLSSRHIPHSSPHSSTAPRSSQHTAPTSPSLSSPISTAYQQSQPPTAQQCSPSSPSPSSSVSQPKASFSLQQPRSAPKLRRLKWWSLIH